MDFLLAVRITGPADARPVPGNIPWPQGFDDFRVGEKNGPAFLPVTLGPAERDTLTCKAGETKRCDACVRLVHALVLDYDVDDRGIPAEDVFARWAGYERVLHSTWTPGRWRVVLPYSRPATPGEHAAVYAWALKREGDLIDASCANPSRLFYLPTVRVDAEPVFGYAEGELLDVDRLSVDLGGGPAFSSPSSTSNAPPSPEVGPTRAGGQPGGGAADAYADVDHVEQREDITLIESRCAFMLRARADAATLPEPEWYAWLSVAARCRGGDEVVHDVGSVHPSYTRDETDAKYERAKRVGPATCAHVRTLSPACKGCPLQVTSPVLLGRREDTPDPHAEVRDAEVALAQARRAEDDALVTVERARRRLTLLRRADAVASEVDVEAAVRAHAEARGAARAAEKNRKGREKDLARAKARVSVEGLPPGADAAVWQRLYLTKEGRPAGTVGNVLSVLGDDPRWSSRLSYDAFALDVLLDGEALPEERATELTAQLSYDYALDTRTIVVAECVRAVARRREQHPVRAWLASLKWDGVARVGDLTLRGFGGIPGDDEELLRLLGEKFLLSLVARAMVPGCKADAMLVLTGDEGTFKSSSLEALVGTPWFARSKLDLLSKDSFINLRGKWLYEVAELGGMKRVEHHASRAWLSNDVDRYRAPYDRRAEDHPRQTVMAGTDNPGEFLDDPMGSRRYWPIPVRKADVAWVSENREMLFAEAVVLRGQGRTHWFDQGTPEAERLRRWSLPYQATHPWTETVAAWLHQTAKTGTFESFTTTDVLLRAIGREVGDLTRGEQTEVGNILRALDCPRVGRDASEGATVTRYRRPEGFAARENIVELRRLA